MVFDNDAWRKTGESVQGGYEEINEEIVRRFGILFGAGEIQQGQEVAESVVDSSEIINTLSGGGVSTVGYAEEEVEERTSGGLLSRLRNDDGEDQLDSAHTTNRITSLVRKAALGRLTLPCEIEGAERALLVLAGPPEYLNRKGIERGRKWLEEQTGSMEVRGGLPVPRRRLRRDRDPARGRHQRPADQGAPAGRHRGAGQPRRDPRRERGEPRRTRQRRQRRTRIAVLRRPS